MGKHGVVVAFVVAPAVSLLACGGSATAPGATSGLCPTISGYGSMCANLDGVPWAASSTATPTNPLSCLRAPFTGGGPPALTCVGYDVQGHALYFVLTGPALGSHPLGPGIGEAGSLGAFNDLATFYDTEPSGGSGTVTITTLTDTQVAGTFSFIVMYVRSVLTNPVPAPAMHAITAGTFNITAVYPAFRQGLGLGIARGRLRLVRG